MGRVMSWYFATLLLGMVGVFGVGRKVFWMLLMLMLLLAFFYEPKVDVSSQQFSSCNEVEINCEAFSGWRDLAEFLSLFCDVGVVGGDSPCEVRCRPNFLSVLFSCC